MAGISTPGLGSGLDVNALVTNLMALERQPLMALAKEPALACQKLIASNLAKKHWRASALVRSK